MKIDNITIKTENYTIDVYGSNYTHINMFIDDIDGKVLDFILNKEQTKQLRDFLNEHYGE